MQQLLAHLVGDYLLQSDWMALEKTKKFWIALVHGFFYALPFLFLTQDPQKLALIAVSHAFIDRVRLARYICWAKNFLAPIGSNKSWADCSATGYPADRPTWLTVWLMIIADNTMHMTVNWLVLR